MKSDKKYDNNVICNEVRRVSGEMAMRQMGGVFGITNK